MAFEYNVPGIDLGAVGRAFVGAFEKQQQLQLKRELYADQLSEKLRTDKKKGILNQDQDIYSEKFEVWANANKEKNRLSKGIFTNRKKFEEANKIATDALNDLSTFTEASRKYAGLAKEFARIYTDKTKIVDVDALITSITDLGSLNTLELNEKYKGGIRTNYDFKEKPDTQLNFNKAILQAINADPLAKKVHSLPGGEMDYTATINGVTKTYKVPSLIIQTSIDPKKVNGAVYFTANQSSDYSGKLRANFAITKNALSDINNPDYDNAKAAFENAASVYGVGVDQVDANMLYSSQFLGLQKNNTIQIPDFKALNAILAQEKFGEVKSMNAARKAKMASDSSNATAKSKVAAMKSALGLLDLAQKTGAIHDPALLQQINAAANPIFGRDLTVSEINDFQAASIKNEQDKLIEMVNIISKNNPGIVKPPPPPGGVPKGK